MAEYIDKNELISKCHPVIDVGMSLGNIGVTLDEIREIPAADVVEVVRCNCCKYYDESTHNCGLYGVKHWGGFFCGDAEEEES